MRRFCTVLTAAIAVVAFSSMVFAQAGTAAQATEKKVEKPAVKTEKPVEKAAVKAEKVAEKPVAKAEKAMSVTGKVAKFDEATKTLTVGEKDFTLAADAKIMSGAKAATTADLAGKTVKVTYTTVDGKNVASKVTIAAEKAAAKAEKKIEKKVEKKEEAKKEEKK